MKRKLLDQFSQASTWRGLVLVASSLGVAIRPDLGDAVIAVGMAIAGLIGVLTNDTVQTQPPAQ
jgi:hypothetical protein